MRIVICFLGSLAVGCATYLLGAIVWSIADPSGAGKVLLFTIPLAIAGMALPAVLLIIGAVTWCNYHPARRQRRRVPADRTRTDITHALDDVEDLSFAA
jgi:hypothetical protein